MRKITGRDVLSSFTGKKALDGTLCSIQSIALDAFKGFAKLHHLNLSNNAIAEMPSNVSAYIHTALTFIILRSL